MTHAMYMWGLPWFAWFFGLGVSITFVLLFLMAIILDWEPKFETFYGIVAGISFIFAFYAIHNVHG